MAIRGRSVLCTAATLLGLLLAAVPPQARAAEHSGPTVRTVEGQVQGFVRNGVSTFLGIPYAAPPVGAQRWQPPQPVAAWTQTLNATKFANTCPQITELGVFAGPVSVTEDCLFLNVFTPHANNGHANNGKKLPVLVWIHGGGLFDGESDDYDATALVKGGPAGPTVVVTINYRLGLLGYFGHPALDAEGHDFGNYGLMDQQAALRWVQRNIAAFGGDPGNVTVGGQSAGSTSTAALVISPASAGLFHRAIFESGPFLTVAPRELAEQRGSKFADAAGCGEEVNGAAAACLRKLSVQKILSLQGTASGERAVRERPDGGRKGAADPRRYGMDDRQVQPHADHERQRRGRGRVRRQHRRTVLRTDVGREIWRSGQEHVRWSRRTGCGSAELSRRNTGRRARQVSAQCIQDPGRRLDRRRHGCERLPASVPQQPRVAVRSAVCL